MTLKNHNSKQIPVITVDGPSGAGKGTLSRRLARALKWHFLESGALYRILAWITLQQNIASDNIPEILKRIDNLHLTFSTENNEIFVEERPIASEIRTETIGNRASIIAENPEIRQKLLLKQRSFCKLPGLIADGRDMGTVIFPEAFLKIYLMASEKERARRRFLELKEQGHDVNLESLLKEIEERDLRDRKRAVAPLKPAEDAVVIDTTVLGVEAVFELVMQKVQAKLPNLPL